MVTKEEIYLARNVDLYEFFRKKGFTIEAERENRYRIKGYGGLIVFGCTYYRHSNDRGGTAIDCLVNEFNYKFEDAVKELIDKSNILHMNEERKVKEKQPFKVPELNKNQHRVFAYLQQTRKIESKLIEYLLKKKLLYQDDFGNCVFPFVNRDGKIVGAEIVGTLDRVRFKKICSGSDYNIAYNINFGHVKKIRIYESAIDMLSYICLYREAVKDSILVSMGGIKREPILHYKKEYPDAIIYMNVDNDEKIKQFLYNIKNEGIEYVLEVPSEDKDWNDQLKRTGCIK